LAGGFILAHERRPCAIGTRGARGTAKQAWGQEVSQRSARLHKQKGRPTIGPAAFDEAILAPYLPAICFGSQEGRVSGAVKCIRSDDVAGTSASVAMAFASVDCMYALADIQLQFTVQ
jgi:hypothetical protein